MSARVEIEAIRGEPADVLVSADRERMRRVCLEQLTEWLPSEVEAVLAIGTDAAVVEGIVRDYADAIWQVVQWDGQSNLEVYGGANERLFLAGAAG